MKNLGLLIILNLLFISITFGQESQKRKKVEIDTKFGVMVIELYNETPKHRDNFLKLVSQKYYDGVLFHRVINNFMIQGGDPNSRNAQPNEQLGNGGPNYTIDAEILPQLFHKKGALAAARQGDNVNPLKKSSGSQFYIVHGQKYTEAQMNATINRANQTQIQELTKEYISKNQKIADQLKEFQEAKLYDSVNSIVQNIMNIVQNSPDFKPKTYRSEKIQAYSTIGGTPHLDEGYTVFGQVVSGLSIIDSIAAQPVGKSDRPIENLKMKIKIVP
ncbi:MAG: peptidylprolyl isomerase [Salinivirgaceae bacterium]|nr:peptidylprolyl isomerase [Salinivirgaceae bacterium]MDD4746114.1 peptidylprolyl isomerase [Salinivirgaceae bacterium]MDY0279854.1 peptidylprolyl isomerase [Salinivirgaceae bacterium]